VGLTTERPLVLLGGVPRWRRRLGAALAAGGVRVVVPTADEARQEERPDADQSRPEAVAGSADRGEVEVLESAKATRPSAFAAELIARFGVPHTVVVLPEVLVERPALEHSEEDWSQAFAAEVLTTVALWQSFVPAIAGAGGGSLVAVLTPDVVHAYPDRSLHAVMRSALSGYVRALALEVATLGIRVNALVTLLEPSADVAAVTARSPAARLPTDDDIANGIRFLSETATFMTGQSLRVDAGWSSVDWALEPSLVAPLAAPRPHAAGDR
jgi:NAD(P)-dependent dehydrogenase (short-subunit alcohol dehydrogenase family)